MNNSHIVAIGGGTGLATLLRGLKRHTANLTAIVTIADDGGSSGRLRADLGMPPPGDARNCLVALSRDESLMGDLFNYRFEGPSSLNGHSLGNLILAALCKMTGGFRQGLEAAAQLLAISGHVIPVSDRNDLILWGETMRGQVIRGEFAVGHSVVGLRRVWIEPGEAHASEAALGAIRQAELIVIGPGSLYTSIIPNFLVQGLNEAVNASRAPKVFVCNVATQPFETDDYGVVDHVKAFQLHSGVALSLVMMNSYLLPFPLEWGQAAVEPLVEVPEFGGEVICVDLVDAALPTRHDPDKLAAALMGIAALDPTALQAEGAKECS